MIAVMNNASPTRLRDERLLRSVAADFVSM
jgi:hypothetical protein